jgi:hypothetical protein
MISASSLNLPMQKFAASAAMCLPHCPVPGGRHQTLHRARTKNE